MNKQEYMQQLEHYLRHLNDEDRLDALEYYSEYIDDLGLDPGDDVCARIGTPREVSRQIIAQTTERKIDEQNTKRTAKGSGSIIWLIILGIFASPIALPLAIALVVILIAFLIIVGSVLFALFVSGAAMIISGVAACVMSFFSGSVSGVFFTAGCGLFVLGAGILIMIGAIKLAGLTGRCLSAIVKNFLRKRAAKEAAAEGGEA